MINEENFIEKYVPFDREIVVEIIDIFIEEYDERIEKIYHHIKTKNLSELQKSTHAFKGVIANFETNCKAYDEISKMESEAQVMLDYEQNAEKTNPAENESFYENIEKVFFSFRKNSRRMLNQLKELRKNYTD